MIESFFHKNPWPWQKRGVESVVNLYRRNQTICLQSPTGGGKSHMMWAITRWGQSMRCRVGILTNRISLCKQLHRNLDEVGIEHGVVAARMKDKLAPDKGVQLMMVQSEVAAIKKRPHVQVDILIVDEAHMFQTGEAAKLIKWHAENGATVVNVTATPIGMFRTCEALVIAGTNSELRQHKAHVPCIVRAPSEFDCSKVKRTVTGEFVVGDLVKKIWNQAIVGHVYDDWRHVNPKAEPTICFGPDCASTLWLAKEFEKRGVRVGYVDANSVYWDGETRHDPDGSNREMIFDLTRQGEVQVLFNRFVCREGLDFPNLKHAILATPIGSLKSYIQTVGRPLRYSPQTPDHVILTDHGGNCHMHGSPNADRDWEALFRMTEEEVYREQKKRAEKGPTEETPITCPRCKQMRKGGPKCPDPPCGCGFECSERKRFVLQENGSIKTLKEKEMKSSKPMNTDQKTWDSLFWSQRKGGGSLNFFQLRNLFRMRKGYNPPATMCNMPTNWQQHGGTKVKELGYEHLIKRKKDAKQPQRVATSTTRTLFGED